MPLSILVSLIVILFVGSLLFWAAASDGYIPAILGCFPMLIPIGLSIWLFATFFCTPVFDESTITIRRVENMDVFVDGPDIVNANELFKRNFEDGQVVKIKQMSQGPYLGITYDITCPYFIEDNE